MAKTLTKVPDPKLYETDYYEWLEQQAQLLREGRIEDIDASNLLEEFEELAMGERASVESHAETVIEHLLKLEHSPAERPRRGWRLTVVRHRGRLAKRLTARLRDRLEASLGDVYSNARRAAAIGLEVDKVRANQLPEDCPYTLDQILDSDWLPKNRHGVANDHSGTT
jgi:Domain of unknown function DUF29